MPTSNASSFPRPASSERALARLLTLPLRILIRAYRLVVSPLLGPHCRFQPSCSAYAEEALLRYGLFTGSVRAAGRLARCHPWNPGGHDPVFDSPWRASEAPASRETDAGERR